MAGIDGHAPDSGRESARCAADRPLDSTGVHSGRNGRGTHEARSLPDLRARVVRRTPQRSRPRWHEPAVAVSPLRAHLRARGLLPRHDARALDDEAAGRKSEGQTRGLVGRITGRGGVSRSVGRLARARIQRMRVHQQLSELWLAARVGEKNAGRAQTRPPRAYVQPGSPRGRGDARSDLERDPTPARRRRLVLRLPANALGQEDSRVDAPPLRRARTHAVADGSLRARRTRSEFVRRLRLGSRALRSPVAEAPHLRDHSLHVVEQRQAQAEDVELPRSSTARRVAADAEVHRPHCESFTSAYGSAPISSTAPDEVQA